MKTRNGFVSNSSSSSFIVKYRYNDNKNKQVKLLTNEQVKKLKKFGFNYTTNNNPYFVGIKIEKTSTNLKQFNKYDQINFSHDVTCNQDDVIYFLLTNKIPFIALCHYEQELVVWDGKSEFLFAMLNILELVNKDIGKKTFDCGENYQYHPSQLTPPIKKINVEEWLKKERNYINSLV